MGRAAPALEGLHAAGRGLPLWWICQIVALGAAFGWFVARSRGEASRLRIGLLLSFGGAALGAAALGVIVRFPGWFGSGEGVKALIGGVVAYGALGGLAASFAGFARLRGVPALRALDRLAPCLGALVIFGRLGCFFAGCDFGSVSGAPWAVRFPQGSPAFADHLARGLVLATDRRSLPVHPTQLYEALLGVLVSLSALAVARRRPAEGAVFWTATSVYAAGRLALDGIRGDAAASMWGWLTASQWFSLALLAAAASHFRAGGERKHVCSTNEADGRGRGDGGDSPLRGVRGRRGRARRRRG